MGGTKRSNGARNQLRGYGRIDAPWHANNKARARKRNKLAKQARKKNRRKK